MNGRGKPVISTLVEASADYYQTLGVDPAADGADIRLAYRNLMRRYHPDVNRSDEAARKATAINEAYACLSDPIERAFHDRQREARKARPTFTPEEGPAPPRHYRPAWQHQHTYMVDLAAEPPPRKWKIISLGLAAVVTLITFKITSEVTGVVLPPPPEPMMFAQPIAPAPPAAAEPDCKRTGASATEACGPTRTPPTP